MARKCFCGYPVFGTDKLTNIGYCKNHQFKRTDKNKKSFSSSDDGNEARENKELETWFNDRKPEMTGQCYECGGKTTKDDVKIWKHSMAHILAKSIFDSVKTHPLNFVELCYYGNSHHTNFDNNGYEYAKVNMPKTYRLIVYRVSVMYPKIKEKDKIPDVLLNDVLEFRQNNKLISQNTNYLTNQKT